MTLTGPNSLSVIGTTGRERRLHLHDASAPAAATPSSRALRRRRRPQQSGLTVVVRRDDERGADAHRPARSRSTVTAGGSGRLRRDRHAHRPERVLARRHHRTGAASYTFSGVGAGSGYTRRGDLRPGDRAADRRQREQRARPRPSRSTIPVGSVQVTVTAGGYGARGRDRDAHRLGRLLGADRDDQLERRLHVHERPGRRRLHGRRDVRHGDREPDRDRVSAGSTDERDRSRSRPARSRPPSRSAAPPLASQTVTVTNGTLLGERHDRRDRRRHVHAASRRRPATRSRRPTARPSSRPAVTVTTGGTTNVTLAIPTGSLKVDRQEPERHRDPGRRRSRSRSTNGITAPAGTTDASGNYTFSNLPTGSAATPSPPPTAPGTVTSSSQTVSNGATTNVALTINTGTITVTVKNQSSDDAQRRRR